MEQKKAWYKRWWVYGIAAFIILGIIYSPTDEERAEQEAQDQKVAEQAKADKEAKKKAEADAKKAKEKAEQAKIDEVIKDFDETGQALIATTEGAVTDVTIEYTGAHYKVNVYVDEATWAASSESEKESFAMTAGNLIQNAIPDTSLVDFRSALNNDIVAEGKVLGGYKIKR